VLARWRLRIAPAAAVVEDMLRTFKSLRFGLMVGIGGGIPCPEKDIDIRLGDVQVVISQPSGTNGGVVQNNRGISRSGERLARKGVLNASLAVLLAALSALQAKYESNDSQVSTHE
jgi:hypothetical protein